MATACLVGTPAYADVVPSTISQQRTDEVRGLILDAQGLPIIGASVKIKGTNRGASTDLDGKFRLTDLPAGATLVVSSIGYVSQEIRVAGREMTITLVEDSKQLDQVVVTALGIKRERKAIGYAMQEVKGSELLQAREQNVANALSGKVSGLQVIRSGNGPGSSSKIQLRGSNSVTGLNQPLIVVDGVPMENFTGAGNNDFWNPTADMGNGIADINAEDIASMSVLKGASAAALYGSRAGNGVVLITTKSGRKNDGLGLTISSTVALETIFMTPRMQDSFGQGENGAYDAQLGLSWGSRIEGQEYTRWDGQKVQMNAFDNVSNYFRSGLNLTENISFSQQFGRTSIYTSLTRMDDRSKIPGAKQGRTNLTARATSAFGKDERWTLDTKIQYINTRTNNRPISGNNHSNSFFAMYLLPRSLDIRDFASGVNPNTGKMLWFGSSQQINPYWMERYKLNEDERDRFLISAALKYKFTDWLNAELRGGSDMYYTSIEHKTYSGSPLNNSYYTKQDRFYEHNMSFLLSAQRDNIFGRWGGSLTFGGNMMSRQYRGLGTNVATLNIPDLFAISNGKENPSPEEGISRKKINSLYGTAQINYDGFLFVDATWRNDWSSTLSPANRSFFYPSLSASWVISEMLTRSGRALPSWLTYAKLRASYAEVGNDLEPYQLYNTYRVNQSPDGRTMVDRQNILFDENVRSELIKSWEVGAELRFLGGRLGLDLSWYKSNATRQLLNLPMDPMGGYEARKINAGNIENSGIELMLSARPIETKDFSWDLNLNFSNNRNRVLSLYEQGDDKISLYKLGGYDNLNVYAVAGGNYGEIWGTRFLRVDDPSSPYHGKLLLDSNGLPQATPGEHKLGDQQAKALLGLSSSLQYKGWGLNFLVDARIGGHIFSGTLQRMQASGTSDMTVVNGAREDMIVDGVIADGKSYKVNDKKVTVQEYWQHVTSRGNLGIGELNLYDATNVRLRTLGLSYTFSRESLRKTPIRQLKLGVSCNNVLMLRSHLNGIDPESVFATSTNATGFEYGSAPTSRTFLFNVTIGF